jgi:solute carrier family 35 protein
MPKLENTTPVSKALWVALFYFFCSISMNFLNKAVVSSYEFNYPFTIMACQMIFTIVLLDSLRISGNLKMQWYSLQEGVQFLPASLTFALHSTLSLIALHGMNIPMYGAIKRCCPLVNLVLSITLLKKPLPSALLTSSIGIITLGAMLAALGDLQFDQYAYFMGGLSVFAQASYLTLVQLNSENHHKSTMEMIYINAYNTLPVFLIMALVLGEPSKVANSLLTEEDSFYYIFILLVVSGSVLTYSQFLCAAVCSALTTSMVGHAKSIIQTILGFYTFGGVKFHPLNVAGLVMNILGGMVYAYVKRMETRRMDRRMSKIDTGPRNILRKKSEVVLSIEDENRNKPNNRVV